MGKVTSNMSTSLLELRAVLNGRVIAPGDASYDEAHTVFYGGHRPASVHDRGLARRLACARDWTRS
jgi:hypothetical protein